jgi:hypothetical protein
VCIPIRRCCRAALGRVAPFFFAGSNASDTSDGSIALKCNDNGTVDADTGHISHDGHSTSVACTGCGDTGSAACPDNRAAADTDDIAAASPSARA